MDFALAPQTQRRGPRPSAGSGRHLPVLAWPSFQISLVTHWVIP